MMDEDFNIWKRLARTFQQTCSNSLGDRLYDRVNEEQLPLKVGYALYNYPTEVDEINKTAVYTKNQQKHINNLCEKIKSVQPSRDGLYYFSCIYIVIRLRNKKKDVGVQVLFRLPQFVGGEPSLDSHMFLDPKPRMYNTWELYLEKNKLPKCDMCYPTNGFYTETNRAVDLTFAASNACKTRTAIFNGLDISSTVLLVGATGISLASLALPIAVPVVWGATATVVASGSYEAARKIYNLHDIKKHGESLGLTNPDARSAWLSIAGSVVGIASIGTTAVAKTVVATESAISRTGLLTLKLLNVSSLAVNGVGVLNGIVTIIMKYINGVLEIKDVVQFTFVCFFFLNAVVSYNIGCKLLEELACSDMKNMFNLRENTCFQVAKDVMQFNQSSSLNLLRDLIRGVRSIFYPDINLDNFESIVFKICELIMMLSSGKIQWPLFCLEMSDVLQKCWNSYEVVILKAIEELKSTFHIVHWQPLLLDQNTTNLEIPRIMCEDSNRALEACGIQSQSPEHQNLMTFARAFSVNGAQTDQDFISRFKFYCDCIVAQFREEMQIYENQLDTQKDEQGFNRESFDHCYGIEGRREVFFFDKALTKVNHPDFLENMNELYNRLPTAKQGVDIQLPFLQTTNSRMYTFFGPNQKDNLEDTFYLSTASDLTGLKIDCENSILKREKHFVFILPNSEQPTSEMADFEAIIINSSFLKGYHMGLLLLLLK